MEPPPNRNESEAREWQIAFNATIDSINRTRRTLVVIMTIACLGFFHLFMWYGSWQKARIAGREGAISKLHSLWSTKRMHTESLAHDRSMAATWESEIAEIKKKLAAAEFKAPFIGFDVSTDDFAVALQIVGIATLLWLIFNQRRVNFCLRKLDELGGWGPPKALLELHFGLVGSHATKLMRGLGRLLPCVLPILSVAFFISDIWDISQILSDRNNALFFNSHEYILRAGVRLGSSVVFMSLILTLGIWSYREWVNTEEELLKFSES